MSKATKKPPGFGNGNTPFSNAAGSAVADDQTRMEAHEIKGILEKEMHRIEKCAVEKHPVTGIRSGFVDLDDLITGFYAGQLIIIAGRPSMGKTALALNICEFAALNQKVPVLIVSLEMEDTEVTSRLLWSRSEVDSHKLTTDDGIDHRDLSKLGKAYVELENAALFIDSTPSRNMLEIRALARDIKLHKGLGLIVVDYIQIVDAGEVRCTRHEEIARIIWNLKAMARELKVPVIALSQLTRVVESRRDRRPYMADLRECGAIEEDADIVFLLHRPDYYDVKDHPGLAEVVVAKNRNGPTGVVKLAFTKNLARFENWSPAAAREA